MKRFDVCSHFPFTNAFGLVYIWEDGQRVYFITFVHISYAILFDLPMCFFLTYVTLLGEAALLHLECFIQEISKSKTRWCSSWSYLRVYHVSVWRIYFIRRMMDAFTFDYCWWIVIGGPTSFESLQTINVVGLPRFCAACQENLNARRIKLLENDVHWDIATAETTVSAHSRQIRSLFPHIFQLIHVNGGRTSTSMICQNTFCIEFVSIHKIHILRRMKSCAIRLWLW